MKVCSVIVTYGDRFYLLKQVIDACLKEGIDKIIVVDNASAENSRRQLKEYKKQIDRLKVIYLDENTGSAGGYKRGLQEAYNCEECEYILCLDDDNILPSGFKKKMESLLVYLSNYNNLMLSCYRTIFESDNLTVNYGFVKEFLGFDYLKKIKLKIYYKNVNSKLSYPLNPIKMSSMGGLFFKKNVINQIGYPKEDFFLYIDDLEYTNRFYKEGGNIFLCKEIVITDIDQTHKKDIYLFHKNYPDIKLYYGVRNTLYFFKQNSNISYFMLNLIIVVFFPLKFLFKTPLNTFFKKYKIYIKAVKDAIFNNLGKRL